MEFKHPKYYKELRKRNTEAVAKSGKSHASLKLSDSTMVKQRASSSTSRDQKQQASSLRPEASSNKQQAPSNKRNLE